MNRIFQKSLWPFLLIFIVAAALRILFLGQFPSGLHYDEAWFGYNAFLIRDRGINIYGQKWPIDLDFFGEHVPATQAYLSIPFITLLGLNAFSIRLTVVVFSLLIMPLAVWLLYRLTGSRTVALVLSVLYTFSPLNIVMSRASSTVIIDSFLLLLYVTVFVEWFKRTPEKISWKPKIFLGLLGIYAVSLAAYATYFTSRLLIPFFGAAVLAYFWFLKTDRKKVMFASLPIALYLLVPFLLLLPTPYARGRFDQTTVINNQTVRFDLTNNILRMGQAGWSPLTTRILHNKVAENGLALAQQYVTFFSPQETLFSLNLPTRYRMPSLGPLTILEYAGLFLGVAGALFADKWKRSEKSSALLFAFLSVVAFLPSALTIDDFPNWQRAAITTPFLQMAAAMGLVFTAQRFGKRFLQYLPFAVLVFSIPTAVKLTENYTAHARYFEPFHRDVAGWKLGEWINSNAHDSKLLLPSVGVYLFPYFQEQSIIPDLLTNTQQKLFIESEEFEIGPRHFVRNLCRSSLVLTQEFEYLILDTKDCPKLPWWVEEVGTITWEDGTIAFRIGKPNKKEQNRLRLQFEKIEGDEQKKIFLQLLFSEQNPVQSAEERT